MLFVKFSLVWRSPAWCCFCGCPQAFFGLAVARLVLFLRLPAGFLWFGGRPPVLFLRLPAGFRLTGFTSAPEPACNLRDMYKLEAVLMRRTT